jgi:phage gp29-like protein
MVQLIPRGAQSDRYPHELSAAFRDGMRLYDPDFALTQDEEIYEKVETDAVIAHAMQQRRHLVAGPEWQIVPGGTDPASKALASVVEDIVLKSSRVGIASARFNLAKAVFCGSTYAAMYGRRRLFGAGGLVPQNWWVPTEIKDIDKRRVRSMIVDGHPQEEIWDVPSMSWKPVENPRWLIRHVYNDDESSLGRGKGLLKAIYYYFRAKAVILARGLDGAEHWAHGKAFWGIDHAAALSSGQTMEQVYRQYLDAYDKMRSKHVMIHNAADKFTHVDGPGQGHQIVIDLLGYLDSGIRIVVLGANLPTEATEGGSYALGKVQENSTDALIRYDTSLLDDTMTRDLLGLVLDLNRPQIVAAGLAGAEMPRFVTVREKASDPLQTSQVIQNALGAGIPLRRDEVYERLGFSIPGPDDEIVEPRSPAAPSPFGAPPAGLGA